MRTVGFAGAFLTAMLLADSAAAHELIGRITDRRTGAAVAGMRLSTRCSGECTRSNTRSGPGGDFRFANVVPGEYRLLADDHPAYPSTLWPDGRCADGPSDCLDPEGAQVVIVDDDQGTTRLDFVLEPYAIITVNAVDGVTGLEPHDALTGTVAVYPETVGPARYGRSIAGARSGISVPGGRYRVAASTSMYVETYYPGVACAAPCTLAAGEVFDLAPGDRVELVLPLAPAYGTVRGRVVDAASQAPLAGAAVFSSFRSAVTTASGEYTLILPALPTALTAHRMPTHAHQLYRTGSNAPVVVPLGGTLDGIDFRLPRTGILAGTVRRTDGNAVPYADIRATPLGGNAYAAVADGDGRYEAFVPAGSYTVSVSAPGLLPQPYRDGSCTPTCASATAIEIAPGERRDGIDFSLEPGGTITGRLTSAERSTLRGEVRVFRESGVLVATVTANDYLPFTTPLLRYGRYRLVGLVDGYAPTAWPDARCASEDDCARFGTTIELGAGREAIEVAFRMQRPPRGRVVVRALDSITGEELEPVAFDDPEYEFVTRGLFYPVFVGDDGKPAPYAGITCALVGYDRACDVPEGVYRVLLYAPSYGDVRWPDVPCESNACAPDAGDPIVVRTGETLSVEATLRRYGRLGGAVRAANGATLAAYEVEVFDAAGHRVRVLPGTARGSFEYGFTTTYSGELAPGRYFARTRNALGYVDRLHAGIACADAACDPRAGTPIDIGAHVDTPLEFNLGESQILLRSGFE